MKLYFFITSIYSSVSKFIILSVFLSVLISFKIKRKLPLSTYIYLILSLLFYISSLFLLTRKEFILLFIVKTTEFSFSLCLNDDLHKISILSVRILSLYILWTFIFLLLSITMMFIYR